MKIVIIDASDTVGRAVTGALSRKHEVARVGRTQGDYQTDITSQESIEALFEKVDRVDTVVSAIGNLSFEPLSAATDQGFNQGLQNKLLGQIRPALTGRHFPNASGSIALISGIITHEPITQGINAATVNAGLEGFVRVAVCELGHDQRISLISPTMLSKSAEVCDSSFPGFENVPTATIASACHHSVEGTQTRCTYKVGYWLCRCR